MISRVQFLKVASSRSYSGFCCHEGTLAVNYDIGRGNFLGIQPYMVPSDYASAGAFHAKLDGYLNTIAKEEQQLHEFEKIPPDLSGKVAKP